MRFWRKRPLSLAKQQELETWIFQFSGQIGIDPIFLLAAAKQFAEEGDSTLIESEDAFALVPTADWQRFWAIYLQLFPLPKTRHLGDNSDMDFNAVGPFRPRMKSSWYRWYRRTDRSIPPFAIW